MRRLQTGGREEQDQNGPQHSAVSATVLLRDDVIWGAVEYLEGKETLVSANFAEYRVGLAQFLLPKQSTQVQQNKVRMH